MIKRGQRADEITKANKILLWLGLMFIIVAIMSSLVPSYVANFVFYILLLIFVILKARKEDISLPMTAPSFKSLLICILITLCIVPMAGLITGLMQHITGYTIETDTSMSFIYAVFLSALLPAVVEEIAVRGLLFGAYEKISVKYCILITALAFAVSHLRYSALPYAFIYGILFGIIRTLLGNLSYSIIMHFTFNLINLIGVYYFSKFSLPLPAFVILAITLFIVAIFILARFVKADKEKFAGNKHKVIELIRKEGVIITIIYAIMIVSINKNQ